MIIKTVSKLDKLSPIVLKKSCILYDQKRHINPYFLCVGTGFSYYALSKALQNPSNHSIKTEVIALTGLTLTCIGLSL